MKYIYIFLFLFLPSVSFGIQIDDLYSQQRIGKTYFQIGFKDMNFRDNSRDYFLDILYSDIFGYIIENIDSETSKVISTKMYKTVSDCEKTFEDEVNEGLEIHFATKNLIKCKDELYSNNIQSIILELNEAKNGMYRSLLEEMFSKNYKYYMTTNKFNLDEFVNQLAQENLVSFSGRLFHGAVKNVPEDEIICENKHADLDVVNKNTKEKVKIINVFGKPYVIKGCTNINDKNYFSYITIWKPGKEINGYDLLARIPFFKYYYLDKTDKIIPSKIDANIKRNRIEIIENISNNNTSLNYVYRIAPNNGVYLQELMLDFDNKRIQIFKEDIARNIIINGNVISNKLIEEMLTNFCNSNYTTCINSGLERRLYPNNVIMYSFD